MLSLSRIYTFFRFASSVYVGTMQTNVLVYRLNELLLGEIICFGHKAKNENLTENIIMQNGNETYSDTAIRTYKYA